MKAIAFLIALFLIAVPLRAEDVHHDHHEEAEAHETSGHNDHKSHDEHAGEEAAVFNVGPDLAVLEADPERGFRLSDKALRMLEVETKPAMGLLPKSSLVHFKDETGVYRVRDGWFKLIEGEAEPEGKLVRFTPENRDALKKGDRIAIKGVPLLRVTELDVFSTGGGDPHGH